MHRFSIGAFAALLLTLMACGGGPSLPSPAGDPVPPSPSPSADEAAVEATPPADETAACVAPLLQGGSAVSFRGLVVGQRKEIFVNTKVPVRIREVELSGTPVDWKYHYIVGEDVDVIIPQDRSRNVQPGDCVLVTGDVGRWACGAACDAVGFLAERFERVQ
ncbi:MAG: hypothetical protein A2W34_01380 [Chloroflexi bacterium RBG_16_64_32]|nr:MAG: hypothetical protein A2W34_01380 [Chloroflexi bacterium RBG_16_64_32]